MTHASMLKDGSIMVKVRLRGRQEIAYRNRQFAVTVKPDAGVVVFKLWGREDKPAEKFHVYPGDTIPDFLTPAEHAIVAAGLRELAEHLSGKDLSSELLEKTIDVVSDVLNCSQRPELLG